MRVRLILFYIENDPLVHYGVTDLKTETACTSKMTELAKVLYFEFLILPFGVIFLLRHGRTGFELKRSNRESNFAYAVMSYWNIFKETFT